MVYGPGAKGNLNQMIKGIRGNWFPPIPNNKNKRSIVHVDDVLRAIDAVITRPESSGKLYIVADRRPYSGREIYDAIRVALDNTKTSSNFMTVPEFIFRLGGGFGDWLNTLPGIRVPLTSCAVEKLLGWECYSPAKIERELGWKSEVSLLNGLTEMLTYEQMA